jgi:hypothetical protein
MLPLQQQQQPRPPQQPELTAATAAALLTSPSALVDPQPTRCSACPHCSESRQGQGWTPLAAAAAAAASRHWAA